MSDVAATAFNGSLSVLMVAPSPWTAGAVAVTGVAYAGTEVWDHWDSITAWAADGGPGRALGSAADTVGHAVAAGTQAAGKALDALEELDLPF